jgi:hypothetical protein
MCIACNELCAGLNHVSDGIESDAVYHNEIVSKKKFFFETDDISFILRDNGM